MNRNTMLAFFVWAIDVDALSLPVEKCWEMFQRDAWGCYKTYTDPSDELLYCPNLIGKDPIDVISSQWRRGDWCVFENFKFHKVSDNLSVLCSEQVIHYHCTGRN